MSDSEIFAYDIYIKTLPYHNNRPHNLEKIYAKLLTDFLWKVIPSGAYYGNYL